jgi:hypothetical protein
VSRSVPGADGGRNGVEVGEVDHGQLDVRGARVVGEVLRGLGAGDGDDVRALGDEPGEGDLRGGGADPAGDVADLGRDVEVGSQVVPLEARQAPPLPKLPARLDKVSVKTGDVPRRSARRCT